MVNETNRLKQLRLDNGLTLTQLSKKAGIPRATLSRYENGDSEPKREVWDKIAQLFDVSTAYLLKFTDNPIRTVGDNSRQTKAYNELEAIKIFFDVSYNFVANSDDLSSNVVSSLDYLLSSIGAVLSNFDKDGSLVDDKGIEYLAHIINAASFLAVGHAYDDNQDRGGIMHELARNDEQAKKDTENLVNTIKNVADELSTHTKKRISKIREDGGVANYVNVLG